MEQLDLTFPRKNQATDRLGQVPPRGVIYFIDRTRIEHGNLRFDFQWRRTRQSIDDEEICLRLAVAEFETCAEFVAPGREGGRQLEAQRNAFLLAGVMSCGLSPSSWSQSPAPPATPVQVADCKARFGLDQTNEALQAVEARAVVKAVIVPS